MRDWRSGQAWDSRTLDDLQWVEIHIRCQGCKHGAIRYPVEFKGKLGPRDRWTTLIPKFKCCICNEKRATAEAKPMPRN